MVKIEKEISWEALLNIKTQIFIAETDDTVVWENPHLSIDYQKKSIDRWNSKDGDVDESFVAIQNSAKNFLQSRKGNVKDIELDKIDEETKEEDEGKTPDKKESKFNREALEQATVEDRKMTFHSAPSDDEEGENEEDEKEPD